MANDEGFFCTSSQFFSHAILDFKNVFHSFPRAVDRTFLLVDFEF